MISRATSGLQVNPCARNNSNTVVLPAPGPPVRIYRWFIVFFTTLVRPTSVPPERWPLGTLLSPISYFPERDSGRRLLILDKERDMRTQPSSAIRSEHHPARFSLIEARLERQA